MGNYKPWGHVTFDCFGYHIPLSGTQKIIWLTQINVTDNLTMHDEIGVNYVVPTGRKTTIIGIKNWDPGSATAFIYSSLDEDASNGSQTMFKNLVIAKVSNTYVQSATPVTAGLFINRALGGTATTSPTEIYLLEEDA